LFTVHSTWSRASSHGPCGMTCLSVIHIQWNFTLKITNICNSKSQPLKNKYVIDLSLGFMLCYIFTWYCPEGKPGK